MIYLVKCNFMSLDSTTQSCYVTLQYNTVLLCHLPVQHSPVMSLYSTTESCYFRRLVSDISNVFRVSIFKVNKSSVILLGPFDPEDEGMILRNVGNYSLNHTSNHCRKTEYSAPPLL